MLSVPGLCRQPDYAALVVHRPALAGWLDFFARHNPVD
jgi:hypothetical protein